jgi:hypothetical protein
MPNKRSPSPAPQSNTPKCEDCRNFSGSAFSLSFGCTKGHAPDYQFSMNREKCDDRALFSRQEIIFKRFEHAPWSGETELKNRKTTVLRTATSLRKALTDFEKVLTSDQLTAFRNAALALDQLSQDIELAGKLLKRHKEEKEAGFQRQREEQLDKIAAEYFGTADVSHILSVADDLASFQSSEGLEWYRNRTKDPKAYFHARQAPGEKAKRYRATPNAQSLAELRRECAACFEAMGIGGAYCSRYDPRMADFEEFRAWIAANKELMRRISAGAGIQPSPPMSS